MRLVYLLLAKSCNNNSVAPLDTTDAKTPDASPSSAPPDPHRHVLAEAVQHAVHLHLGEHLSEHLARIENLVAGGRQKVGAAHLGQHLPAWCRPTDGEPRLPVALAVVSAIALQVAIPDRLAIGPRWLLPGLVAALLAILTIANPGRINQERRWLRWASLTLVAVASVANTWSAGALVYGLIQGTEGASAGPLLATGGAIWLTNVLVFGFWYWEFDRGGPSARAHGRHHHPDFQFPQMQSPTLAHQDWEPTFVDYLYLSFTNATAFSPTDTMPMTRWAKMAMLAQSAVSLATVALVIARAINILK
jgi:uncharacterized membrane protein